MKLFYFYIGGDMDGALVELHDARFVIAKDLPSCFPALKKSWWGKPASLHLDCWGELTSADGHNIHVRDVPPPEGADRLFFVNLGGYTQNEFTELHKNVLVAAPNESKAKVKALKTILDWDGHHKDYQFEIEKIFNVDDITDGKFYIHLDPSPNPVPFSFNYGYKPIGKPDYVFKE